VTEREQALLRLAADRLRPFWHELSAAGWKSEVIVFAPEEIKRLPGYKIALVVSLDSIPTVAEQKGVKFDA
jgi:hypothetical protein